MEWQFIIKEARDIWGENVLSFQLNDLLTLSMNLLHCHCPVGSEREKQKKVKFCLHVYM